MKYEADFSLNAKLSDDTPVHLRMIRPDDAEGIRAGLKEMSEESRYRRFLTSVDNLPDSMVTYLTDVDGIDHVAMVCETAAREGSRARIVGAGRFVRDEKTPETAEMAVAVVDEFHRRGMATLMLKHLSEAARERGIERFAALVSEENDPMKSLIGDSGVENTASAGDGAVMYNLELPAAGTDSFRDSPIYKMLRASADERAMFLFRLLRKPIQRVKKPLDSVKAKAKAQVKSRRE